MTAYDLYRDGKLDEAIDAALQRVKSAPTDVDGRLLLCDLLCLDHQLERADRQLDVLVQQDAELAPGVGVYRQLVRAARARTDAFESGRPPELKDAMTDVLALHLRASMALREGQASEAGALLAEAEAVRPIVAGECDGESFDDLRDLDDLTAPFLEVLTSTGKYYWIGWEQLDTLAFRPPQCLRDLLWRQADVAFREGPDAVVYVPVLYLGSHASEDVDLRLGRKTAWIERPDGPTAGIGQRTLLVGDRDRSLLSIGRISFQPGSRPAAAG